MANQQQLPLRTVIAGAAHGVWMAVLVGVVLMVISMVAREVAMRFYPVLLAMAWGVPLHELPDLMAQVFAYFKVMVGFFLLLGVALSSWWRALPAVEPGE